MAHYVLLYRFTDQGRKTVRDTVKRASEVRKRNEERGFKILGQYWTMGRYDLVAVVDAPSDEAVMAGMLGISEAGNVYSETLHAFTEKEMEAIMAKA